MKTKRPRKFHPPAADAHRFCPICGGKFQASKKRPSREKLVTVARFGNAIEAHLARTKLESKGISSYVADEHFISLNPIYDIALGGARLQILEKDLVPASKLLGVEKRGSFWAPSLLVFSTHLIFSYLMGLVLIAGALVIYWGAGKTLWLDEIFRAMGVVFFGLILSWSIAKWRRQKT